MQGSCVLPRLKSLAVPGLMLAAWAATPRHDREGGRRLPRPAAAAGGRVSEQAVCACMAATLLTVLVHRILLLILPPVLACSLSRERTPSMCSVEADEAEAEDSVPMDRVGHQCLVSQHYGLDVT